MPIPPKACLRGQFAAQTLLPSPGNVSADRHRRHTHCRPVGNLLSAQVEFWKRFQVATAARPRLSPTPRLPYRNPPPPIPWIRPSGNRCFHPSPRDAAIEERSVHCKDEILPSATVFHGTAGRRCPNRATTG